MRRWARWLVVVSAALAGIAIVAPPLLYAYHRWMTRTTWRELEARWEHLRKKYPPDEGNESARELQALAAPLGIDLAAHRPNSPTPSPRPGPMSPLDELSFKELRRYIDSSMKSPGDVIPEPPVAVSDYLQGHRGDIDRLVAHLADGPAPRWPSEVGDPNAPGLEGPHLFAMTALLSAEALWQERRGAHAEAQRALQAHWRLGRAFAHHPRSTTRLASDGYAFAAVKLLRKLDRLPSTWQQRLGEVDPHGELEEALDLLTLEIAALVQVEKKGGWLLQTAARDQAIAVRWTAADYASHAPCALGATTLNKRLQRRRGFWSVAFTDIYPDVSGSWERADHLVVELELARKLLGLEARRDAEGGAWPAAVPGIESSACVGAHWTYAVTPDGHMTLAFSRGFGDQPPLTFSAAARPLH